jgi:hypothetical protein
MVGSRVDLDAAMDQKRRVSKGHRREQAACCNIRSFGTVIYMLISLWNAAGMVAYQCRHPSSEQRLCQSVTESVTEASFSITLSRCRCIKDSTEDNPKD